MIGTMMRIAGKVEFIDNPDLREKVLNDRPFLKDLGVTMESDKLVIFRIAHGEAYFWTMANNLKPKEIVKF